MRAAIALILMTIGAAGMYAAVVALKPVSVEFGASRGAASLPYAVHMVAFGLGGIAMGRWSDRVGVMWPGLLGALGAGLGFILASQAGALWQFALVHGLLIAFVGQAAVYAPLVADITHWFDRHRGMAVAIVISGSYVAGAVWPPVVQHFVDAAGWRATYFGIGVFCLLTMAPLSLVLRRRPPAVDAAAAAAAAALVPERPLQLSRVHLQGLLCAAGIGCCAAMAMPQVHIIAHATDLGHAAQRGAEMLALMLGCGIVSRLASGWISDRIGGIRTLLLGSGLQAVALALFIPVDGLTALYVMSALFGLSQGGIVPSYAIIVRTFFPSREAGWRIATVLLFTMLGMAVGGWMAGMLYDLTGSYTAAFANAVAFNLGNIAIAAGLLWRAERRQRPAAALGD